MKGKKIYSSRYVGYIDILGFKNLLKNKDPIYIKKILNTLEREKKENYYMKKGDKPANGVEISLFSDSLLISYPETDAITGKDNLFYLIIDMLFIQFDLAFYGVFVRGGVAKGDLYHDSDVCFGKALVDAVELEKSAVYPRIIIPNDTLIEAINNNVKNDQRYSQYNTFESEAEDFYKVLKRDADGMWYVNFMLQADEFDNGDAYISMLEKIKEKCDDVLNECKNDHIRIKYLWLKNKLLETVKDKSLRIPILDDQEYAYLKERLDSLINSEERENNGYGKVKPYE